MLIHNLPGSKLWLPHSVAWITVVAILLSLAFPSALNAADFYRIDPIRGAHSKVLGVSNNFGAAVAAGVSSVGGGEWRGIWHLNLAVVAVPNLGGTSGAALGINADGNLLVGWSSYESNDFTLVHAVRWRRFGETIDLGTLGGCCSMAYGANATGTVVVGSTTTNSGDQHAFRWIEGIGMQSIGSLGGPTVARSVSSSGHAVVGYGSVIEGSWSRQRAFRWTTDTGMLELGDLGSGESVAYGISPNGQEAVGTSKDAEGVDHAFLWTESRGMVALHLPPGCRAVANCIGPATYGWSSGGEYSAIGGWMASADGQSRAVIWREDLGIVDLTAYLEARLLLPSGWDILQEVTCISHDGMSIGGVGAFYGETRGFVIQGLRLGDVECTGDANFDGMIDANDIAAVLAHWGLMTSDPRIDANGDGLVDGADLSILLNSWGACP